MVTGDHPRTAVAIAREIGLVRSDAPTIVTGDQLRTLVGRRAATGAGRRRDRLRARRRRSEAAHRRSVEEQAAGRGGDRRRRQRRAGAQGGAHRRGDGHSRHRRGQGGRRHGAARRQLREHRERGRGRARRLREHPEVPDVRAGAQRRRAGAVPLFSVVQDSIGADADSGAVDRHGLRHADGARPRRGARRPADHAAAAARTERTAAELGRRIARLSVSRSDRSRRGNGRVLLRSSRCRLAIRSGVGGLRIRCTCGPPPHV